MKAEVTLNARQTFTEATLGAGLAPSLAAIAPFPPTGDVLAYPLQKDCNTQGQVTSLYYPYSKDLRNSGNKFGFSTLAPAGIALADQGVIQFRGEGPIQAGTPVGSIKFTWYVRFHGRTRPVPVANQRSTRTN